MPTARFDDILEPVAPRLASLDDIVEVFDPEKEAEKELRRLGTPMDVAPAGKATGSLPKPGLLKQAGEDLERGVYNTIGSMAGGIDATRRALGTKIQAEPAWEASTGYTDDKTRREGKPAPAQLEFGWKTPERSQVLSDVEQGAKAEAARIDVTGPKRMADIGNVEDFTRYAVRNVMENVPNMAASIAGGVGAGAKGAAVISYLQNAGEVYGNLSEKGIDHPGLAAAAGVPMGLLDTLEPLNVLGKEKPEVAKAIWDRVLGEVGKALDAQPGDRMLTRAARGAAEGTLAELPTEATQEAIGIGAEKIATGDYAPTLADVERVAEAGFAGGLTGGALGGAGSAVRRAPLAPQPPPSAPLPSVPPNYPQGATKLPPSNAQPKVPERTEDLRQKTVVPTSPVDVETVYPQAVELARNSTTFGVTRLRKALGVDLDQAKEILARLERDGEAIPQESTPGRKFWINPKQPGAKQKKDATPSPASSTPPVDLPDSFANQTGTYELTGVQGGNVTYRFARNADGAVVDLSMPVGDWQKVAEQSGPAVVPIPEPLQAEPVMAGPETIPPPDETIPPIGETEAEIPETEAPLPETDPVVTKLDELTAKVDALQQAVAPPLEQQAETIPEENVPVDYVEEVRPELVQEPPLQDQQVAEQVDEVAQSEAEPVQSGNGFPDGPQVPESVPESDTIEDAILATVREISGGQLLNAARLRGGWLSRVPKSARDRALLNLWRDGKVWLSQHHDPAGLTAEDVEAIVQDEKGNNYNAVSVLNPAERTPGTVSPTGEREEVIPPSEQAPAVAATPPSAPVSARPNPRKKHWEAKRKAEEEPAAQPFEQYKPGKTRIKKPPYSQHDAIVGGVKWHSDRKGAWRGDAPAAWGESVGMLLPIEKLIPAQRGNVVAPIGFRDEGRDRAIFFNDGSAMSSTLYDYSIRRGVTAWTRVPGPQANVFQGWDARGDRVAIVVAAFKSDVPESLRSRVGPIMESEQTDEPGRVQPRPQPSREAGQGQPQQRPVASVDEIVSTVDGQPDEARDSVPADPVERRDESGDHRDVPEQGDADREGVGSDRRADDARGAVSEPVPDGGVKPGKPFPRDHRIQEDSPASMGFMGSGYIEYYMRKLYRAIRDWVKGRKGRGDIARVVLPDADVEGRFQGAKTANRGAFWQDVRERLVELIHGFSRTYVHLDPERFGGLINELAKLNRSYAMAVHKAAEAVVKTVQELRPNEFDLFTKAVVLADMVATVDEFEARGETWDALPFGYTPQKARADKAFIDAEVAKHPVLGAALDMRRTLMETVRRNYIRAMKSAGSSRDLVKTLSRKDYYHHRVLAHLSEQIASGRVKKLEMPTKAGFLRERTVNALDYSTDYIASEFEILKEMMNGTAKALTIAYVRDPQNGLNILPGLKRQAKAANADATMWYFERMSDEMAAGGEERIPPEKLYRRIMNWRIASAYEKLQDAIGKGLAPDAPQWDAFLSAVDFDAAEANRYAAWVLGATDAAAYPEVHAASKAIFAAIKHKQDLTKNLAGKNYVDPKDTDALVKRFAPDHTAWQPEKGSTFFMGHTIPEELAQKMTETGLDQIISPADLRRALVLAGPKASVVIPDPVATTLDDLGRTETPNVMTRATRAVMGQTKRVLLIFPTRAPKYIIRNLSGDAEATFVGNPRAFRWVARSVRDLWRFFRRGEMSPEFKQWFERGGIEATMVVQEADDLKFLDELSHLLDPEHHRGQPIGIDMMKRAWNAVLKPGATSARFAESILRYANFLEYSDQIRRGGRPLNYGASIPEAVQQITDPVDKAFKLANDLAGAYDEISATGQQLRRGLLPFWAFSEINMRRYYRLMRNAIRNDAAAATVGARLLTGTRVSIVTAARVGRVVLAVAALKVLTEIYNNWMWPEEEDELNESQRQKAHVILGRDADGNVITFDRIGILDEMLEWVGLDGGFVYARQLLNGKRTPREIAVEMAKSPVNKLVNMVGPQYKGIWEVAMGKSTYPDAFNPRTMRDRTEYVTDLFGVTRPYRQAQQKAVPQRDWGKALRDQLVYTTDPGQVAYWDARDMVARWKKANDKGEGGGFARLDRRGEALYNVRMALRYGDEVALQHNLEEYILSYPPTAGLNSFERGLKQSIAGMHPLSGLNRQDRAGFTASLSVEDQARLDRALRFYDEHFGTGYAEVRPLLSGAKVAAEARR